MTIEERRRRIGRLHHLAAADRIEEVERIVDDLVAIHSSDPASVYLGIAARMSKPSSAAIDDALYRDRTAIRHHAMRRTLWVCTPAMAARCHAATNRKIIEAEVRRLSGLLEVNGVTDDPAGWIEAASDELMSIVTDAGPVTTRQLGERLPHLVIRLAAQGTTVTAHARVLLLLGFRARIVRTRPIGSWISSQYAWSTTADWIGADLVEIDEREARSQVLDAYLARYGPATMTDMSWWTGWTKSDVATAVADCHAVEVDLAGEAGWVSIDDIDPEPTEPWVALLPGLDSTTMGWKDRDWYLQPEIAARLFDRNGNGGPTVWMDGRVVGAWFQRRSGEIAYELLDDEAESRRSELDAAASTLEDFYGDLRHRVRFPSPILRDFGRSASGE